MADKLDQLRALLNARDAASDRVSALEAQAAKEGAPVGRMQSKLERETRQIAAMDKKIERLRDGIARDRDRARAAQLEAEESLESLTALRASGELTEEEYDPRRQELADTLALITGRIEVAEKTLAAKSAAEMDWLDSVPVEQRATEAETGRGQKPGEMTVTEFPGASVPERVAMLWREARKPQSRRPIIISGAFVSILTLLVVVVVLISGHMNPKSPADYLGKGEVLVPVLVDNADNIRSLEFTLNYDPVTLTGMSVIQGDVGRLAVMQYDINRAGRIEVLVRDVTGINGTGSIVIMRFKVTSFEPNPTSLNFLSVEAVDVLTRGEKATATEDGWIDTLKLDVMAPVVRFP